MENVKYILLKPISLIYLGVIGLSLSLLGPASELDSDAGMLPKSMLFLLVVFSLFSLLGIAKDVFKGSRQDMTVLKSPQRVLFALLAMLALIVCVEILGFYPTIIIFVPLVSYFFGCKNFKVLFLSTVIFVSFVYLIFSFAMSKEFPTGWII
ncbi:tripartite tricarboxylate transporter TctB family protein [Vibrio sp. C8]